MLEVFCVETENRTRYIYSQWMSGSFESLDEKKHGKSQIINISSLRNSLQSLRKSRILDNMFGPLFDFNRDGKTDAFEFAMGMGLLEELEKDENDENS